MKAASLSDSLTQASWICLCRAGVDGASTVDSRSRWRWRPTSLPGVGDVCVQLYMQHGATSKLQPTHQPQSPSWPAKRGTDLIPTSARTAIATSSTLFLSSIHWTAPAPGRSTPCRAGARLEDSQGEALGQMLLMGGGG